jgi:hypothetical protein
MIWRLPDTYHSAGHGRGTATLKFYEGRDILRTSPGRSEIRPAGTRMRARADLTYEASGRWTAARSTTQIIMVTS